MKKVMIQGTTSSAGKTTLVAGLCRILAQDGKKVCPFKSQNMALNSFVDAKGREVSRATAMQAEAASTELETAMNPILLKPNSDTSSQVLLEGKPYANMEAKDYFQNTSLFKEVAKKNFDSLAERYDYCVLEGGGSPAEINLREQDYVNMGMAEMVDAPVLLVANIEMGGALASLYGTVMLLSKEDRARIKGLIINKFQGDKSLLEPGLRMLEERFQVEGVDVKVLGVLPKIPLKLEEEDSLSDRYLYEKAARDKLVISIVLGDKAGNLSDFDVFRHYEDVQVRYVRKAEELGEDDLIILPGSKNTLEEIRKLQERGFFEAIQKRHEEGCAIFGICGGFQALGKKIVDAKGVDGTMGEVEGLGLFDMESSMAEEKMKQQKIARIDSSEGLLKDCYGLSVKGYEIHHGRSTIETLIHHKEDVYGTYLHGIFDADAFREAFLNALRRRKKLAEQEEKNYQEWKEREYDRLAEMLRNSLDMEKIYEIFG